MTQGAEPNSFRRGPGSRERRQPEEALIARLIPNGPPQTLYDLGPGVFSEFRTLKAIYPDLVLFGAEPCPHEFAEVQPIFAGKLLPVAIGNPPGKREFWLARPGIGGSSFFRVEGDGCIEVDVWTLDQFDEWAGKPSGILLWADIEGAELEALQGGHELLASGRVEWINLETRDAHASGHPTTADLNAFLRPYGYVPVQRYNMQGSYPEAPGDTIYFKKGVKPKMECNWGRVPK